MQCKRQSVCHLPVKPQNICQLATRQSQKQMLITVLMCISAKREARDER